MDGTIERPQSEAEKADFILIGTPTIYDEFNRKLADFTLDINKKFKPFDGACARLDFRDKLEQAERESTRTYGFVKEDLRIEFSDFSKYAKDERFELLEDKEEREEVLVNGLRTWVISGHTLSYRCKARGHGIAVFIPIAEYKELKGKK